MSIVVRVTEAAVHDQIEAAEWYDDQQFGLGSIFETNVSSAIRRLNIEAYYYRTRFQDVRRAPIKRFEVYGLFYIVRESEVVVFALVHGARNPAWVRRRRREL